MRSFSGLAFLDLGAGEVGVVGVVGVPRAASGEDMEGTARTLSDIGWGPLVVAVVVVGEEKKDRNQLFFGVTLGLGDVDGDGLTEPW